MKVNIDYLITERTLRTPGKKGLASPNCAALTNNHHLQAWGVVLQHGGAVNTYGGSYLEKHS
jgi:hypothetical protein